MPTTNHFFTPASVDHNIEELFRYLSGSTSFPSRVYVVPISRRKENPPTKQKVTPIPRPINKAKCECNEKNYNCNTLKHQQKEEFMPANVYRNEYATTVEFELAGFDKDNIRYDLKNGLLTIVATRTFGNDIVHQGLETVKKGMVKVPIRLTREDMNVFYIDGILRISFRNNRAEKINIE